MVEDLFLSLRQCSSVNFIMGFRIAAAAAAAPRRRRSATTPTGQRDLHSFVDEYAAPASGVWLGVGNGWLAGSLARFIARVRRRPGRAMLTQRFG